MHGETNENHGQTNLVRNRDGLSSTGAYSAWVQTARPGSPMLNTVRTALAVFVPPGSRIKWFGVAALALLVAGAEYVTAILIFGILDFAASAGGTSTDLPLPVLDIDLAWLLVVAGSAFLLRELLALAALYYQEKVVQTSSGAVSALLHRRYLYAPYRFHLTRNSSELVRTAVLSVDRAAGDVIRPLITMVIQVPIVLTLVVLLVIISPILTILAAVTVAVVLLLVLRVVQRRLRDLGRRSERIMTSLLGSLRDSFDSLRDVKAYGAEPFFDARFKEHREAETRLRIHRFTLAAIPSRLLEFVVLSGLLVLVGLVQTGQSFTELVPILGVFAYATLRIIPSINKIVSASNSLRFGQQSVLNVSRDLEESAVAIPTEPGPHQPATGHLFRETIELDSVGFTYPGAASAALENVDLEIRRGEMIAIVGASGAGKSTLIDILLRLLEPDSGSILVDRAETAPAGWRDHVGVVSQRVVLIDGTVRENVAFGAAERSDARVREALEQAELSDWVATLPKGIDTRVGESGKLVSGGQRQRIAIARSLYRNPQLLILDEATSDVDAATEAALLENFRTSEREMTTIVVSHRLAPIEVSDRVVMLSGGRITHQGPYLELADTVPEFRRLVGL